MGLLRGQTRPISGVLVEIRAQKIVAKGQPR
jgi:hypothetical protein